MLFWLLSVWSDKDQIKFSEYLVVWPSIEMAPLKCNSVTLPFGLNWFVSLEVCRNVISLYVSGEMSAAIVNFCFLF